MSTQLEHPYVLLGFIQSKEREEVKGLCVQLRIDDDPQLPLSKQHLKVALNFPLNTFDGIFLSFQCSRFLVVVVLFI